MPAWFCLDTAGANPCYDTKSVFVLDQSVYTNALIGDKAAPMIIHCNKKVYTIILNGESYTHYYHSGSVADAICDVEMGIRK